MLRPPVRLVERREALPAGGLGARLRFSLHPKVQRRHGHRTHCRYVIKKKKKRNCQALPVPASICDRRETENVIEE
jgi:hypothetical protein